MRIIIFLMLCGLCMGMAFWRGGQPEKAVAGSFLGMLIVDATLHSFLPMTYRSIDLAHFLIDATGWVVFYLVALNAHRLWTLVVAALQTIALASHAVPLLSVSVNPVVYGTMQVAATYPALVLLLIGTVRHYRRRIAFGDDQAWSI